jgi:putative nucleotidyltransferase with HDIG domain
LLPEILKLVSRPNVDSSELVALISYDPALTANVLRLCNSAALGVVAPVTHLEDAIFRIGFNQVFRLTVASSAAGLIRSRKGVELMWQEQLWAHSVVSAAAAQIIAADCGRDEPVAFTAGLLHDLGKIVVLDVLGEKYVRVLDESSANQLSLIDIERRVCGVQHAELGARLLSRWKFPLNLGAPICFHHDPLAAGEHKTLAAILYLANFVAYAMEYGCGDPGMLKGGPGVALHLLNLEEKTLADYQSQVHERFHLVQTLIQMAN